MTMRQFLKSIFTTGSIFFANSFKLSLITSETQQPLTEKGKSRLQFRAGRHSAEVRVQEQ